MTLPEGAFPVTQTYALSVREVIAIKRALLQMRGKEFQGLTGLSLDETVELEEKLLWRAD